MPKNIVLLSDGTGNSAANLTKTNVWRLYRALNLSHPRQQIAFYDDGVGTSSFRPLAIIGGAFGYGVKRNVLDLYTFLCRNYEPGDSIYIFGFSRGAFTARAVAGLIDSEGIVPATTEKDLMRDSKTAYREYRRKRFSAAIPFDRIGRFLRDLLLGDKGYAARAKSHERPNVRFLGLWDSVAAYGLPIDEMTRALNWVWRLYPKDREAPNCVRRVCHALALDDERYTFHPMLFNEQNEPDRNENFDNIRKERITQVWFAGMHSNVGGGYPDDGLSHVPLLWMLDEAEAAGLAMDPNARKELVDAANPVGKLYDSRQGLGGLYRYMPRKIWPMTHQDVSSRGACVVIDRPKIHESVFGRISTGTDRYAPIGLPPRYAVVTRDGAIVPASEAVESDTEAASRANQQEQVWNIVWWKRVAYFSSIGFGIALLIFPLILPAKAACTGGFCWASPIIGWAGTLAPGFLQTWVDAYKTHPEWFFIIAGAFIALLALGKRLQIRINDAMRAIRNQRLVRSGTELAQVALPPDSFLYRLRTNKLYVGFFDLLKARIIPALFAFVMVVMLAGATSRLAFKALASQGLVCGGANPEGNDLFSTRAVCWDTGQDVREGHIYRVTLSIAAGEPYEDDTIPANLGGFGLDEMPLTFKLMQPLVVLFRRNLVENWYKPFMRVGKKGTDEYVLEPPNRPTTDIKADTMTSEITARSTGRVFLYVNDAVLPVLSDDLQVFYKNNHGKLKFTMAEVNP